MFQDENIVKALALMELAPDDTFTINEGVVNWLGPGPQPNAEDVEAKIAEVQVRVGYTPPNH